MGLKSTERILPEFEHTRRLLGLLRVSHEQGRPMVYSAGLMVGGLLDFGFGVSGLWSVGVYTSGPLLPASLGGEGAAAQQQRAVGADQGYPLRPSPIPVHMPVHSHSQCPSFQFPVSTGFLIYRKFLVGFPLVIYQY